MCRSTPPRPNIVIINDLSEKQNKIAEEHTHAHGEEIKIPCVHGYRRPNTLRTWMPSPGAVVMDEIKVEGS